MSLNASKIKSSGNFPKQDPLEPGTYPARVVQIIGLGMQAQQPFQGEEKPPRPEIYVTYELVDEFVLDDKGNEDHDKPRWISERIPLYSLDSDLAKSTKRYFALDPNCEFGGDWAQLAGQCCMVTIINKKAVKGKHAGKVFDRVDSISSMRDKEAKKMPGLKNDPKVFDVDEPNMTVFLSLPTWLQDLVKGNLDFGGSVLEKELSKMPNKEEKEVEEVVEEDESEDSDW